MVTRLFTLLHFKATPEEILQCRPDASDLINEKGQTALHVAVIGGKEDAVS
ncbi:conserved hypothetical protein [Ricinus communis]|uniref:Ankyrin repeat-containing protein n=1 Tax=Ricinus communis TaxID=3988 RepID=B9RGX8_RICCO|nr:conserved hypothetical protein [Ricinus communis]